LRKINFLFGVHLHQPVGNFPTVFKLATESAYLPFLRAMSEVDSFPFALHASGPLWEYWEKQFPEIFDVVSKMVEAGQMELIGGGFYEPVLAVIPRRDAIAQLEMMSDFLDDHFGVKPRGAWLTERVWEPHLAELLAAAGIEYTCVDDYHFKSVGIIGERLLGYYITEDNGCPIKIFPISEDLRYSIPFQQPQNTVEFLVRNADESGERTLVFADDGEKFGLWPGTRKWVWEEGWMKRFLDTLSDNREIIELHRFDSWIDSHHPIGRVYLPTTSYFEMSEWTLPAELSAEFHNRVHQLRESGELEQWRPFLKGGFWRNFLTKYPEAAWMHKRMLYASSKLSDSNDKAAKALYRAQCNCAYWHGVFGGLYLPHLRRGVYDNIIQAENLTSEEDGELTFERADMNLDGYEEIILKSDNLQLFIAPADGGKIAEIDFPKYARNITDTLSRRPEGYHQLMKQIDIDRMDAEEGATSIHDIVQTKEEGLANLLHYDQYNRRFLVDFVFGEGLTPKGFHTGDVPDIGDFANSPYEVIEGPEKSESGIRVVLQRSGGVYHGDLRTPLTIEKAITLHESGDKFSVRYVIKNPGDEELRFRFGIETHLSLMSRDNPNVHFHFPKVSLKNIRPGEKREFDEIDGYEMHEHADGFALSCRCDNGALWMWPVETVSNSESGFERIYQQTSLLHHWQLIIPPTGEDAINMTWMVSKLPEKTQGK